MEGVSVSRIEQEIQEALQWVRLGDDLSRTERGEWHAAANCMDRAAFAFLTLASHLTTSDRFLTELSALFGLEHPSGSSVASSSSSLLSMGAATSGFSSSISSENENETTATTTTTAGATTATSMNHPSSPTQPFEELSSSIFEDPQSLPKFSDIACLDSAKNLLMETIVLPSQFPEWFKGIRSPWRGILLYGPPGTGKTLLAKAAGGESGSFFFSVSPSSLLSKYMGESERILSLVFRMAKENTPSIIFFDEIDSIGLSRSMQEGGGGGGGGGGDGSMRRVLAELLVQISNLSPNDRVTLIAATNRIDDVDPALLRRFERRIEVSFLSRKDREMLIRKKMEEVDVDDDDDDDEKEKEEEIAKDSNNDDDVVVNIIGRKRIFGGGKFALHRIEEEEIDEKEDEEDINQSPKRKKKREDEEEEKKENIPSCNNNLSIINNNKRYLKERTNVFYLASKLTDLWTAAEIELLCREASMIPLREAISKLSPSFSSSPPSPPSSLRAVTKEDFKIAYSTLSDSVNIRERRLQCNNSKKRKGE